MPTPTVANLLADEAGWDRLSSVGAATQVQHAASQCVNGATARPHLSSACVWVRRGAQVLTDSPLLHPVAPPRVPPSVRDPHRHVPRAAPASRLTMRDGIWPWLRRSGAPSDVLALTNASSGGTEG